MDRPSYPPKISGGGVRWVRGWDRAPHLGGGGFLTPLQIVPHTVLLQLFFWRIPIFCLPWHVHSPIPTSFNFFYHRNILVSSNTSLQFMHRTGYTRRIFEERGALSRSFCLGLYGFPGLQFYTSMFMRQQVGLLFLGRDHIRIQNYQNWIFVFLAPLSTFVLWALFISLFYLYRVTRWETANRGIDPNTYQYLYNRMALPNPYVGRQY